MHRQPFATDLRIVNIFIRKAICCWYSIPIVFFIVSFNIMWYIVVKYPRDKWCCSPGEISRTKRNERNERDENTATTTWKIWILLANKCIEHRAHKSHSNRDEQKKTTTRWAKMSYQLREKRRKLWPNQTSLSVRFDSNKTERKQQQHRAVR